MKKRTKAFLMATVLLLTFAFMQSTTVLATASYLDEPEGGVGAEVAGYISTYYTVGEAYRGEEVGLNIYDAAGNYLYYNDNLEFWANSQKIRSGYKFQSAGSKVMTVRRGSYEAQYELVVAPASSAPSAPATPSTPKVQLRECYLLSTMSKLSYRQDRDPFDPSDIVVRCVYTDGSYKDLRHSSLKFYVKKAGNTSGADGQLIKSGYVFKTAGQKELTVRAYDYDAKIPFVVTSSYSSSSSSSSSSSTISECYLLSEPTKRTYRQNVDSFDPKGTVVRVVYANGTHKDLGYKSLKFYVNGPKGIADNSAGQLIKSGYKFKTSGNKELIIRVYDYEAKLPIVVTSSAR